jgi:uncharacterized protein
MVQHKIIFTGPVGAGKTTAIQSLSDIPMVKTDVSASDAPNIVKTTTTVAMDYGVHNLANGDKIHLYGTPGQERFDFMWTILASGGMGLVVLLSNNRPNPVADMWCYLEAFKGFIGKTQAAIGVTQMDIKPKPDIVDYQMELKSAHLQVPVYAVDARQKKDLSILVQSLLTYLNTRRV